jgi:hypothetical protein
MKKILSITAVALFAVVFGSLISSALGINAFIGVGSVGAASLVLSNVTIPGVSFNTLVFPMPNQNVDRAAAQEYKRQSRVLTSYEGGANSYEGGANSYMGKSTKYSYAGEQRNGDGAAFAKEIGSNISFGFRITNTDSADQYIAWLPTFLGSAANLASYTGQTVDGVLTDGTIVTGKVTGASTDSALKIAYMQEFIKNNPARIVEIVMQSDSADQFATQFVIGQVSPFRKLSTNSLDLTDYTPPTNFNDKKAIIPIAVSFPEMQLDNQTLILIPVKAGSVLKVTIKIGLVHNPASMLYADGTNAWDAMKADGIVQVQA